MDQQRLTSLVANDSQRILTLDQVNRLSSLYLCGSFSFTSMKWLCYGCSLHDLHDKWGKSEQECFALVHRVCGAPSRAAEASTHALRRVSTCAAKWSISPEGPAMRESCTTPTCTCVSNPSEFRAQDRERVLLRGAVRCLLTVQMLVSCWMSCSANGWQS